MGDVKIRYYVKKGGERPGTRRMGYWAPCLARPHKKTGVFEPTIQSKLGFKHIDCGEDGPHAWMIAESWNKKWDAALAAYRAGKAVDDIRAGAGERVWPGNSIGEAFVKYKRLATWAAKKPRTQEDWERAWKLIEPYFGDVDPRTVTLEGVDLWYGGDPKDPSVKGLLQTVGVREAHRAMKIWRALWKNILAALTRADGTRYVTSADPSLGIRRKTPKPRDQIWLHEEAVRLVKRAVRLKFYGLAAALAVAWDTQLSPVDVVSLSSSALTSDAHGTLFSVDRTKSERSVVATVTRRTARLFRWYICQLPFGLHPETPFFHTRGGEPGPKGGRPRPPVPYKVDTLGKDFAKVRAIELPGDRRQVADFRRSGGVEAIAGRVDLSWLAAKMGNSIDRSKFLQRTYLPQVASVVRLADEARVRGRAQLRGSKGTV